MFRLFEPLRDAAGLAEMIAADAGGGGSSSEPASPPPPTATPAPASSPAAQPSAGSDLDIPDQDDFEIDIDADPEAAEQAEEPVKPLAAEAEQQENTDPDSEVGKLLATPRGKRIYAAFKQQQLLAQPPSEDGSGGIGFAPTVEQIKDFYNAKHSLDLMEHHFDSGQGLKPFLNWWFGQKNGSMRQGAAQLSEQLPDLMQQVNPAMNAKLASNYVGRYVNAAVDRLLEAARNEPDEEKQNRLYYAAQLLHKDAHDRWFDPKQRGKSQVTAEPVSQELRELTRLKQQIDQGRQAQQVEAVSTFVTTTDNKIDKALEYDVNQALASIRDHYKDQPMLWESLRDRFVRDVQKSVQQNADGMKRFNLRYETAQRNLSPEDQQDVVRMYRQLAAPLIVQKRSEYLKAAGVALKQASDDRHAKLATAAGKRNLTQTGQPVRQDISKAIQREPGESHVRYLERQMAADMNVA